MNMSVDIDNDGGNLPESHDDADDDDADDDADDDDADDDLHEKELC